MQRDGPFTGVELLCLQLLNVHYFLEERDYVIKHHGILGSFPETESFSFIDPQMINVS